MDQEIDLEQESINPELEVAEDTIADETIETLEVIEDTVPKSQFNQVLARAKAAEAKLKATAPAKQINNTTPALSEEQVHVAILKAQGKTQDEIDYLKKIAAVNKTTVIDAQTDELFIGFQKKKEDEVKAQKAKLGASRGSGTVKKEKSINSSGLTEAEHRELWKAQQGR